MKSGRYGRAGGTGDADAEVAQELVRTTRKRSAPDPG